jgi:hypothetical protein
VTSLIAQSPAPGVTTAGLIRRTQMDDVLYLGLTALFFLLALAVLKGVDRL